MQDTVRSLLAGLAPNFVLISIGLLLLLGAAFLLGLASRSSQLWYDRLATWRIRRFAHYGVGDRVTLGANIQGTVTKLTPFSTVLIKPDQTQVTLSNSFVLRHPIYIHPALPTQNPPEARLTARMDGEMLRTPPEATMTAPSAAEDAGETKNDAQFSDWVVAEPSVLQERSFALQHATAPDAFAALALSDQPAPTESDATLAQPFPSTTSATPFAHEASFANAQEEAAAPMKLTITSLADAPIAEPMPNVGEPEGTADLAKLQQLPVARLPVHRIARLQPRPTLGKYTVKRFKRVRSII